MAARAHLNGDDLSFRCPGCQDDHLVTLGPGGWTWDGSLDLPTISPSLLVTYETRPDAPDEAKAWCAARRCHSFITAGRIQFLGDCGHQLVGQTVDLPDWNPGDTGQPPTDTSP
jgi:hypothetical protein